MRTVPVFPGNVLMSICATIGEPVVVDMNACIHDGFVVFDQFEKELDGNFLLHLLRQISPEFRAQGQTGTQANLNTNIVKNAVVCVPASIEEQGEIAEILSAIDVAIDKTEAIVAKLKQIRTGLLLDLLTPEAQPSEQWSFIRLGDVCEHITKGATPTTFGFGWVDDGILFLRSECVTEDGASLVGSQRVSPQAHAVMARSAVRGGDLLMTITGYIGRTCRYPIDWPEANINQHIARIRIRDREALTPEFALWALKHPAVLRALELEVTGLAYPQIGLAQVQNIHIHAPSLERQVEIAAALDGQQAELKACEAQLAKLIAIKQGLSDDLLIGRVRVLAELEMA
jgi:type I restriction enzyme, S subunit